MAQVTVFNAARMKQIEDTTVTSGLVDVNGNLLLSTREGTEINAGRVKGDKGDKGDAGYQGIDGSAASPAGTIALWASDVAPANWLICDGSAVSRTTYASLFTIIGTKYGAGDGVNTFNLPNLKGQTPIGKDSAQTEFAALNQKGGEKAHLLTAAESGLPAHNHTQNAHSHTTTTLYYLSDGVTGQITGEAIMGGNRSSLYPNASKYNSMPDQGSSATTATNNASAAANAAQAHNVLQPYTVVNFIIKVTNGDTPGDSQLTQRVSDLETNFSSTPAGTMTLWPSDVAPTNWLICDGAAVSRTTYASLFAAIGIKYGAGDGSTTFNLPNLKGRVPVGRDAAQAEFDTLGETGGTKTHNHWHINPLGMSSGTVYAIDPSSSAMDLNGSHNDFYQIVNNIPLTNLAAKTSGAIEVHGVTSTDSGTLQPYQVVNYIIKFTNGDTKGDSQLTQRVSALESGNNNAMWLEQKMRMLQTIITGGGVRRVFQTGFSWSERFGVLGTGVDETTPNGFFNIDMPPDGTVIPVYSHSTTTSITVANGLIPFNEWGALYYDVPVGQGSASQPSRFRWVSYTQTVQQAHIPPTWVLVAATNLDPFSAILKWGDGRSQDYWHTLSLINGWVAYDAAQTSFTTAQWKFNDDGQIVTQGLVKNGSLAAIGFLDSKLAPVTTQIFNQIATGGLARVDVSADGSIAVVGYSATGGNGYVSLAGVSWSPKQ